MSEDQRTGSGEGAPGGGTDGPGADEPGQRASWWSSPDGTSAPSEGATAAGSPAATAGEDSAAPTAPAAPAAPEAPGRTAEVTAPGAAAGPVTPAPVTPTSPTPPPAQGAPTGTTGTTGTAGTAGGQDPWGAPGSGDTVLLSLDGDPVQDVDTTGRPRRPRARTGLVAAVAVLALFMGLVGGAVGSWAQEEWRTRDGASFDPDYELPAPAEGTSARDPESVAGIAQAVLPSVVSIETSGGGGEGTGSGFVFDAQGLILTNNHVVAAADEAGADIRVVFEDGSFEPAEVVGRDGNYDLAVLRVERADLSPLPLAASESVLVGDPVVAIGAPLGLQSTVTSGIVSALNRPVAAGGGQGEEAFINAIQTDAAINPGNSGGPLLNAAGEVIGVNSAIARVPGLPAQATGNIGLGFAIPSDQARRTAEQLVQTGRATYPIVGVLLDNTYTGQGVRVASEAVEGTDPITPGGPADNAGIEPGDVIVAFEGRPVTAPDELIVAIRSRTPGDRVELVLLRDEQERTVELELEAAG